MILSSEAETSLQGEARKEVITEEYGCAEELWSEGQLSSFGSETALPTAFASLRI